MLFYIDLDAIWLIIYFKSFIVYIKMWKGRRLKVNQRWPGVPSRGSLWFLSNNTTETRNIKTTFIGRRIKKNCKYVQKDYYPLYRILNAMLKPNTVHCSERFNLTLTPGILQYIIVYFNKGITTWAINVYAIYILYPCNQAQSHTSTCIRKNELAYILSSLY